MPELFASQQKSHNMQYNYLGTSGLKVSQLTLGAMTFSVTGAKPFGGLPVATQEESHAIMDAFVEGGGNFLDTADCYGESEQCVGNWLTKKTKSDPQFRSKVVIATKVRNQVGDNVNSEGLSRKHIHAQIEISLAALQTDYVDLLQVHLWDSGTPLRETLQALTDLVRAGKVRYIGCSNFNAWHIVEAEAISNKYGLEHFVTVQNQYSLLARQVEWSITEVCERYGGIGILPWSPLAGGLLSGKYKRGQNEPDSESRAKWADSVGWNATSLKGQQDSALFDILDEAEKIAGELDTNVAAVALRWLIQQKSVSSTIIGAKSVKQLQDNLKSVDIKLTDEQVQRLNKVSGVASAPYPWNMIAPFNQGRHRSQAPYPL